MNIDIYFGDLKDHKIDWRKELKDESDDDNIYEEEPTEQYIIDMLGFDPDDYKDEE